MMVRCSRLAVLGPILSIATAQTSSECNPLKTTCPANPAIGAVWDTDFKTAKGIPDGWKVVNQGSITYNGQGANLVVAKQGDNPTLESTGYYLFGSLDVKIKAAPGVGIVTSIVMLSDDLDEVDWELLGGNGAQVQSNYFGKGDTSTYDRSIWHAVSAPQTTSHNYKVDWTPSTITWYIDGTVVRTLNYADAKGGSIYPQTPMKVRIGIWAGGDPGNSEGTIQWAGGKTDYSKAPFTMILESVSVRNYSPGKSYTWGDNSGAYKSINIEGGTLMGGQGGSRVGTSSKTSASSLTTSLSKASPAPTNPLTTVDVKISANSTAPTSKGTPSPTTSSRQTGNAAAHVDAKAMAGGVGAILALAMALFA